MSARISKTLKSRRLSLGLSQSEAGALAGMSQQQYQSTETGKDVRISTLLKVLNALNLDLSIDEGHGEEFNVKGFGYGVMDELLKGLSDD